MSTVSPQLEGFGYCCPLCLHASPNVRAFTVEDVPPRATGGRPLVLTCKNCNDYGGHQLDCHWSRLTNLQAFVEGDLIDPVTATLTCQGVSVRVAVTSIGQTIATRVIEGASNPVMVRQASRQRLTPDTSVELSFNRDRFSHWRARLSVLRAAYLTAFAVQGYRFVRHWQPIRSQLQTPDQRALLRLVHYDSNLPSSRRLLGVVDEPADCRSIVVGFGRWTAFVPLASDSKLYMPIVEPEPFHFRGRQVAPWPTEPTYGLRID